MLNCNLCGQPSDHLYRFKRNDDETRTATCYNCSKCLHGDEWSLVDDRAFMIFGVSHKPHPQTDHMASRLFPIGRVVEYTDDKIIVFVKTKNVYAVYDQVTEYLTDRRCVMTSYEGPRMSVIEDEELDCSKCPSDACGRECPKHTLHGVEGF